jgi:hypothetical protein
MFALNWSKWLASHSGHLNPIEDVRYGSLNGNQPEHCIGDWVSPRTGTLYRGMKGPRTSAFCRKVDGSPSQTLIQENGWDPWPLHYVGDWVWPRTGTLYRRIKGPRTSAFCRKVDGSHSQTLVHEKGWDPWPLYYVGDWVSPYKWPDGTHSQSIVRMTEETHSPSGQEAKLKDFFYPQ